MTTPTIALSQYSAFKAAGNSVSLTLGSDNQTITWVAKVYDAFGNSSDQTVVGNVADIDNCLAGYNSQASYINAQINNIDTLKTDLNIS